MDATRFPPQKLQALLGSFSESATFHCPNKGIIESEGQKLVFLNIAVPLFMAFRETNRKPTARMGPQAAVLEAAEGAARCAAAGLPGRSRCGPQGFLPHVSLYEVPVFTNMDIHAYTYIPA